MIWEEILPTCANPTQWNKTNTNDICLFISSQVIPVYDYYSKLIVYFWIVDQKYLIALSVSYSNIILTNCQSPFVVQLDFGTHNISSHYYMFIIDLHKAGYIEDVAKRLVIPSNTTHSKHNNGLSQTVISWSKISRLEAISDGHCFW